MAPLSQLLSPNCPSSASSLLRTPKPAASRRTIRSLSRSATPICRFRDSEFGRSNSAGGSFSSPPLSLRPDPSSLGHDWTIRSAYAYPPESPEEATKRALALKQIENSAVSFKRLGRLGFWAQLVCSVVSAVILVFSIYISGRPTSAVTTYLTAGGIVAAFLSVFWSFGYMRLGDRLRDVLNSNLEKAPSRTSVVDNLKSGLIINLVGLASTLIGLQATVGLLVAKALSSSVTPVAQGFPASYNPVLALDVFLVQASTNTLLSHFIGLLFTLELIRIITRPQPPAPNLPKPAPGSFLS